MRTDHILYKYRAYSARSLEMLLRREVYFAPPDKLNDPYDCQLSIRDALREAVEKARRDSGSKLEQVLTKLQSIDHVYEKMESDVASLGVFSLSECSKIVLMWSYYAENHAGFCVGFRFSKNFTTYRNEQGIIGIAAAYYSTGNPFVEFFEEIAQRESPLEWVDFWQSLLSRGMVVKAKAWEHEQEVRVLRKSLGVVSFDTTEIAEIVFGMNMPAPHRETIQRLLSGSEWRHVRFKEIRRASGFSVELHDVDLA